ncbi:MAG: sugar ABC transporter permease [Pleurocapsa sp. SU_196_0]|nr:sugar ABC transporter permease [Pleurocapsa sp. SU_196_0]
MSAISEPVTPVTRRSPSLWKQIRKSGWYYLFLLPWLVMLLLFVVYPQLASYPYTLLEWDGIGTSRWVGLENFQRVINDEFFWKAFRHTFTYAAILVPVQLFLALILALTLNSPRLRFSNFYRAIFFSPVVTSTAIIGIIMSFLMNNIGPAIQPLFRSLGLIGATENLNLLADPRFTLYTITAIGIWKTLGINMVYFLAALQGIPKELYEAARIDGANVRDEFWHITIPGLRETGLIIIFLAFLGSLQVFELVQVMAGQGPNALFLESDVVNTYVYRTAFGTNRQIGLASAAALTMGLITLALSILQIVVFRRFGVRQGGFGLPNANPKPRTEA